MLTYIIRTPTIGLIFDDKNAYYTRKITVSKQTHVQGHGIHLDILFEKNERWLKPSLLMKKNRNFDIFIYLLVIGYLYALTSFYTKIT